MNLNKLAAAMALVALSLPATASMHDGWTFSGGFGFGQTLDMRNKDGSAAFKRLAIAKTLMNKGDMTFGAEVGTQDGNHMRLQLTATQETRLGGTAVQTTINQAVDFLVFARKSFKTKMMPMSAYAKVGAVYRSMHFDRDTINSIRKVNAEIQVGLSTHLSEHVMLSAGYQGIISSANVGLTVTAAGDGTVKRIPSQHNGLVTVSYTV